MWLSLVERLLWEQDAAGSNPVIPTIKRGRKSCPHEKPRFYRGFSLSMRALEGVQHFCGGQLFMIPLYKRKARALYSDLNLCCKTDVTLLFFASAAVTASVATYSHPASLAAFPKVRNI